MRHGAACRDELAECDWPACYEPVCARCAGKVTEEFPLFIAKATGSASGPYCSTECAQADKLLGRTHPAIEQRCEFLESATRMSRWMR